MDYDILFLIHLYGEKGIFTMKILNANQMRKADETAIKEYFEDTTHTDKLMVEQLINLLDCHLPLLSVLIKNYNDYDEYVKVEEERLQRTNSGKESDEDEA